MQLAEKLCITDRAVSKWETGRALPDSSIMLELCEILKITVNDLLCGEVVSMDNYNSELEKRLLEMVKQKEESIVTEECELFKKINLSEKKGMVFLRFCY